MSYISAEYDVIIYFRSEVIVKYVENVASDGFRWNFSRMVQARITKFHVVL